MHELVAKAAQEMGFGGAYFLPPARLLAWHENSKKTGWGKGLSWDIPADFPWAGSILLLVRPYVPFEPNERLPSYYLASHAGYAAAKELANFATEQGVRAENALLPARALALHHGLGRAGKNGLLRIAPYGSRITLHTLACGLEPLPFARQPEPACPPGCTACRAACPAAAIGPGGLKVAACMRAHMESAEHPAWVLQNLRWFVGCEACMFACPFNPPGYKQPTAEQRQAFELGRLIAGDAAAARALVGRNMSKNGKLSAEAVAFAAKSGLHQQRVLQALASGTEAVRRAAEWALEQPWPKQK